MSKRSQETQGGEERYGGYGGEQASMTDKPQQATAAQLARRRIATGRKPSGSQRNSRANTPTANPFGGPQQQSMPAFQLPGQSSAGGGGFNFTAAPASNPFAQQQNGTPPPTTFQFGSQPAAQQIGGGGMFGGGNGTSFGSTAAQPQQNGFNPSTTSMFGGSSNSFGFGQSQPQPNGVTPSTNASFPPFGAQTSDNPFKGFGQSEQTPSAPSASFAFGQGAQQQNGNATPFAGFGQTATSQPNGGNSLFSTAETPKPASISNIFGGFGKQPNGEKTPFGTTSQAEQTPKASTSGMFGAAPSTTTAPSLFGNPAPSKDASNGTGSVIQGLDAARASTIKPGMFSSNQSGASTPASSNIFSFGQQNNNAAKEQDAPKPSSLFSGFGQAEQTNGEQTNAFPQTPKPNNGTSQEQNTTTTGFQFGQSQAQIEDANMTTPGQTPQKPSLFGNSLTQPSTLQASQTPTAPSTNLFSGFGKTTPATAQKGSFTPSTSSLFSGAPKEQAQPLATPAKSLFDRVSPREETPPTAQKQSTFPASASLFNKPSETASSMPSAAPWISHAPSAPSTTVTPPTPRASASQRPLTSAAGASKASSESNKLKKLNQALLSHLRTQDSNLDWSKIMQYYVEQAAGVHNKGKSTSGWPTAANTTSQGPTSGGMFASAQSSSKTANAASPAKTAPRELFGSQTPRPTPSTASNMFSNAASQQTPKQRPGFNSQPPATAPVNNKRPAPFEEDDGVEAGPATEKRTRMHEPIDYPKLPENASNTAKLFEAALQKSASVAATPAASASSGFKPSTSSASSGMPTFAAPATGSGSFLSAFGQKANAEEEKAKKKRKMEDYDSDDETEEQWEKRDREEQEAKKRKIEEAAKSGSGFSVPPSSNGSVSGTPDPETPIGGGKSLFDRVSKDPPATAPSKTGLFSSQTPGAGKPTSSLFQSQTPGATSTTWNTDTPIKFGGSAAAESTTPAAPPPKLGNLFGANGSAGSSSLLNVPGSKPSLGFNFGGQTGSSVGTSRASTPGMTTDGEGASTAGEEEDSAAPTEEQLADQTDLQASEKAESDLLFSVRMAKASKLDDKKSDDGSTVAKGWVEKGKGPLYILKNRETGKVRVLLKIPPLGKAAMNFGVLPKFAFETAGTKGTVVKGQFIDHLASQTTPKPWTIMVGKKEDAEEMARVLQEAAGL